MECLKDIFPNGLDQGFSMGSELGQRKTGMCVNDMYDTGMTNALIWRCAFRHFIRWNWFGKNNYQCNHFLTARRLAGTCNWSKDKSRTLKVLAQEFLRWCNPSYEHLPRPEQLNFREVQYGSLFQQKIVHTVLRSVLRAGTINFRREDFTVGCSFNKWVGKLCLRVLRIV